MTGDDRSDPLSDVLNIFAAPLAGTIRSFDQFRKGVDEFLRGVENFNRTMETLNETAERINVLLGEVEGPIKAAMPQVTRTVKLADEVMQVVSGPAIAAAPALRQLTELMSTPGIGQLPAQLGQFTEVMADMSKRLGPLTQFAESAGGLFGGLRFPGSSSSRPAPAAGAGVGVERELVETRPMATRTVPTARPAATPPATGRGPRRPRPRSRRRRSHRRRNRPSSDRPPRTRRRRSRPPDALRRTRRPSAERAQPTNGVATTWPGRSLPRTSTTTCSPCAVSGGRKANAIP